MLQGRKALLLCFVFLTLFSSSVLAQTPSRVMSNSEDWRDVYSVMQFGVLQDVTSSFLVSSRHATLITNQIPDSESLWVFSSDEIPYVVGYESLLRSKGYEVEEFRYDNINLELARLLEDVNSYVVIDDSYGYNAISVAPYAALTRSFVLFADRNNIDDIVDFLEDQALEDLIVYGPVDREVTSALAQFDPETINKDGDRFENNIEIVKKYREVSPAKQIILTNGEFIEQEIMTGSQPVVFIGANNVPETIQAFIASSDIEVGVLIGNELVGTATSIRRELGISVFVKFAQGARAPQGSISQVEALDMFYLPTYTLNMEIENVRYNRATNQLEVTLKNTEDQALYFLGTYTLTASDGSRHVLPRDEEANEILFLDGNEIKTLAYSPREPIPEGALSGEIFIVYGESIGSLEREIRATLDIESVRIIDSCDVDLEAVSLNPGKQTFYLDVKNIGDVECYVDAELLGILVAGQSIDVGSDEQVNIRPGKSATLKVELEDFEEEDVEDNEQIDVRVFYGERENNLYKFKDYTMEVSLKKGDLVFYTLLFVIIVLLILVIMRRKKNKEKDKK